MDKITNMRMTTNKDFQRIHESIVDIDTILLSPSSPQVNPLIENRQAVDLVLPSAEVHPLSGNIQSINTEALLEPFKGIQQLSEAMAVSMAPTLKGIQQLSEAMAVSMAPTLKGIQQLSEAMTVSMNSFVVSLPSNIGNAPRYIPARHLGSGPFLEDTEQDDTDSLMVIRMSDLHPGVLFSCKSELSNRDYFHAVLEAIKGLCQRIRDLTGLQTDGYSLIEQALAYKKGPPYIALNPLKTSSQRNVQEGFIHQLIGLILMYRHPLAHEPKITWLLGETEALSVLLQISECHRRIDYAVIRRII